MEKTSLVVQAEPQEHVIFVPEWATPGAWSAGVGENLVLGI
jgi:hypothetical protein